MVNQAILKHCLISTHSLSQATSDMKVYKPIKLLQPLNQKLQQHHPLIEISCLPQSRPPTWMHRASPLQLAQDLPREAVKMTKL